MGSVHSCTKLNECCLSSAGNLNQVTNNQGPINENSSLSADRTGYYEQPVDHDSDKHTVQMLIDRKATDMIINPEFLITMLGSKLSLNIQARFTEHSWMGDPQFAGPANTSDGRFILRMEVRSMAGKEVIICYGDTKFSRNTNLPAFILNMEKKQLIVGFLSDELNLHGKAIIYLDNLHIFFGTIDLNQLTGGKWLYSNGHEREIGDFKSNGNVLYSEKNFSSLATPNHQNTGSGFNH